jgi:surface antigen
VSIDAIRWANDTSLDPLKPWMIIKIPPTSGVIHIVKKWDTLWAIAVKYGIASTDITSFNQLNKDPVLRIGQELMIPWAQKKTQVTTTTSVTSAKQVPVPQKTPSTKPVLVDSTTGLKSSYAIIYTGKSRWFVAGNCTAYVAQNKTVTWRGNAKMWIRNARAQWVPTGSKPIPGAIVQFSGRGYSRAYGHVGIVADVKDGYIIVRDMNYRWLYEITVRKVSVDDPAIDGYIYVD